MWLPSWYAHVCVGTSLDNSAWVAVLDGVVILISFVSLVQCLRSLINSWRLAITVRKFFLMKFDKFRVKVHHLLPLFNFWHVGVIVSNVLVIVGSLLKLLISYNVSPPPPPSTHSLIIEHLSLSLSLSFSLSHTHTHTHIHTKVQLLGWKLVLFNLPYQNFNQTL